MRNFFDNLVTFIITILIILIIALTTYFCLDVFGIITVPAKYSLASFFYTQVDVLAVGNDQTLPEKPTKEQENIVVSEEVEKPEEIIPEEIPENYASEVLNKFDAYLSQSSSSQIEDGEIEPDVQVVSMNRFYYEQLDSYGKKIYDKLYENLEELKNDEFELDFGFEFDELLHTETGSKVLHDAFQLSVNALVLDNPDLFYLNINRICLTTKTTKRAFSTSYEVIVGSNEGGVLTDGFKKREYIDNTKNNLDGIKNEIIKVCKDKTKKDQIKIVHDYLVDTIVYDSEAGPDIYNIYGALMIRRSVCEGYARACKYVLDDLGIPCIIACGVGTNTNGESERHAWNYVYLNGQWYALDVTWDDPIITGGGKVTDSIKYAYFLKGSEEFFKDHVEDGKIVDGASFTYPVLSTTNY